MRQLILISFLCFSAILMAAMPAVVFAKNPVPPGETTYPEAYVPCGTEDEKHPEAQMVSGKPVIKDGKPLVSMVDGADGIVDNPCGFNDVIEFARRAITGWIMAGATIAALGFAYAGYLYITAMGSQEKISHAHMIFVKTFWGFVFMLSAWLIAKTMENVFLTDEMKAKSFLDTTPPATDTKTVAP